MGMKMRKVITLHISNNVERIPERSNDVYKPEVATRLPSISRRIFSVTKEYFVTLIVNQCPSDESNGPTAFVKIDLTLSRV